MKIKKTKILTPKQEEQIDKLWNEEYPVKLVNRFKLLIVGIINFNHYIIEDKFNNIIAWAVDFEIDKQIRFSIIVASQYKGIGLGGMLIDKLKAENKEFYGWVIDHNDDLKSNGEKYQTPLPFYIKHGFEILHDIRKNNEMINAVKVRWKNEK